MRPPQRTRVIGTKFLDVLREAKGGGIIVINLGPPVITLTVLDTDLRRTGIEWLVETGVVLALLRSGRLLDHSSERHFTPRRQPALPPGGGIELLVFGGIRHRHLTRRAGRIPRGVPGEDLSRYAT